MITTTLVFYLNEIGGRKNLEDAIYPAPGALIPGTRVFLVCDGVGGLSKGEEASRIVTTIVGQALSSVSEVSEDVVIAAIKKAQQEMQRYINLDPTAANMSTTLTLAVLRQGDILLAWSGDSRIIHIRDGHILYQTDDHSLVRHLVKSGQITEAEAETHPKRNVILRAVNADADFAAPDFHLISDIKNGDWLLLCTDGVLENLRPQNIKELFWHGADGTGLQKKFDQLCRNKTSDNYSLYALKLQYTPAEATGPTRSTPTHLIIAICTIIILATLALGMKLYLSDTAPKNSVASNTGNILTPVPVHIVATRPMYPGGDSAWYTYCISEIRYPKAAIKKKLQGPVSLRCTIDSTGKAMIVEYLTRNGSGLEEELDRVIRKARWLPAERNGQTATDTLTVTWLYSKMYQKKTKPMHHRKRRDS